MSRHNEQYPSKVLTKNLTQIPRTLSQANRDAYYCNALVEFKSDTKLTLDFLGQAIIGALWTLCAVGGVGGLIYWLFRN